MLQTGAILNFSQHQPFGLCQNAGAGKRFIGGHLPVNRKRNDDFAEKRRQEVEPADPG